MNVLFITNLCLGYSATLPERNLFKGLIEKGVKITAIAHWQTPESLELESYGVKMVYLPITRKIDIAAIRKIRSLIKNDGFDIMHLTYGKAITNGLIASSGLAIKIVAYLGSLSLYWHDPFSYLSFFNRRISKLICLSDGVRDHVLEQAPGRMKDKTLRIYKGYNPSWLKEVKPADRKSFGLPSDAFIICCVANVRKVKGVLYLIKAADFLAENLPVYFLLVGKRTNSSFIAKMIKKTKYSRNFITIGYSTEPLSYTAVCDLYIQPSLSEGLGRSVIEAMCLGKPVIVTDKGGAKELVNEGINGFVIPVKSSQSIAETIMKCYNIRGSLPEFGEKARQRILDDFSPEVMIDQTYRLYTGLINK
jgi:glycosyltransferase involved in cell wall biosynthesis